MINLVYGGLYSLILLIPFITGYWLGKKIGIEEGRDSCAETAGQLISKFCCPECLERIKRFTSGNH